MPIKKRRIFELEFENITEKQIDEILQKGEDINAKNIHGETLLMLISKDYEDSGKIELLLKKGADINAKTPSGWSSLMFACKASSPFFLETLLKHGANINDKNSEKETALIIASGENVDPLVTETLLKHGANVNDKNISGETALMLAIKQNLDPRIVEILLKAGADINTGGSFPPIRFMMEFRPYIPMFELLLQYGARPRKELVDTIVKRRDAYIEMIEVLEKYTKD